MNNHTIVTNSLILLLFYDWLQMVERWRSKGGGGGEIDPLIKAKNKPIQAKLNTT